MRMKLWAGMLAAAGMMTAVAVVAQAPMNGAMPGMNMGSGMEMGHDHAMAKPNVPAGVLRVTVAGKSTDWTLAQLAAMPHKTATLFNSHAKANQSYAGVPLMELLLKAGVAAKPHGKDLALYLAAVGSDGYVAVYSVAEVNPDVHEGTVLVADAVDGKPLTDDGPLKLVSAGETRPARWVRNLALIKVDAAQ